MDQSSEFDAGDRWPTRARCCGRWNRRARFESKADQNLAHRLGEIRRIGGALGLGESIQAEAGQLFREAQSADLIRGRSLESMASASVYAACRRRRLPRFLDEIASDRYSIINPQEVYLPIIGALQQCGETAAFG